MLLETDTGTAVSVLTWFTTLACVSLATFLVFHVLFHHQPDQFFFFFFFLQSQRKEGQTLRRSEGSWLVKSVRRFCRSKTGKRREDCERARKINRWKEGRTN